MDLSLLARSGGFASTAADGKATDNAVGVSGMAKAAKRPLALAGNAKAMSKRMRPMARPAHDEVNLPDGISG